jgi:drug/metabolite transporter (DMT)-like permease
MDRGRLALRLALIAVAAMIFFTRGGQHNPQFMWGFGAALAFALAVTVVRTVIDSKRKKAAQAPRSSSETKSVDLFTKPRDF